MAKRKGRPRTPRPVTLGGDHGQTTAMATANSEIIPIEGDKNGTGRRQRRHTLTSLFKAQKLTQRQFQAGEAIEKAYCRVQMLSSGGELKEHVQSSPNPDAAVAMQVDAISHQVYVKKAIPRTQRRLVEHVCEGNNPLRTSGVGRPLGRLCSALDRVADHLRY